MVVEMFFGKRYILNGHSMLAALKLNKFIYPYPTHFLPGLLQYAVKMEAPPILKVSAGLPKVNLPIEFPG
jgi:hypothetical protein